MKNILLSILLMTLISWSSAQTLNTSKSIVDFKIGSVGFIKVKGDFTNLTGSIKFNENDLAKSSIQVKLDVSTLNTGNKKRDTHLKNKDFFEVVKYPSMQFISSSISKTEAAFIAKGKLTIKEVTKEIEISFSIKNEGKEKILSGEFEIERLDYNVGLGQSKILVDNKVKLFITCVLNTNKWLLLFLPQNELPTLKVI